MSNYPQKRQRISGSFSPASPPYHVEAIESDRSKVLDKQPQTPLSPSPMSFTSQNNASFSLSNTSHPNTSPPTSVSMSQPAVPGILERAIEETKSDDAQAKRSTGIDLEMPDVSGVDATQKSGSVEDVKRVDYERTDHDRCNKLSRERKQNSSNWLNSAIYPLYKLCEYRKVPDLFENLLRCV